MTKQIKNCQKTRKNSEIVIMSNASQVLNEAFVIILQPLIRIICNNLVDSFCTVTIFPFTWSSWLACDNFSIFSSFKLCSFCSASMNIQIVGLCAPSNCKKPQCYPLQELLVFAKHYSMNSVELFEQGRSCL